jgi:hypothetical protein
MRNNFLVSLVQKMYIKIKIIKKQWQKMLQTE